MKKIYLFFLAILLSIQSFAQQYQVAGTCTMGLGTNTYGPMNSTTNSSATSRVAVIYPASQLTGISGQLLNSIFFKKITTANMAGTPNFKVYLKETASADFGAAAIDWTTATAGATLVYDSNPVTASTGAAGWKQFNFSTNFIYSGAQNLMVLMEYVNTGNTVNTTWEYEYTSPCVVTTNSNTTKYVNNTTGTAGSSLNSSNYRRPFISFGHISAANCTGTVTAGTASASASAVCANIPFTLSLTGATVGAGVTYQWQRSPAGANTFTNIAGATALSYTVTNQTTASDYRCVVTCTNGGSTQNSNVVTVGLNTGGQCINYCTPIYTYNCGSGDDLNSFVITGVTPSVISDLNTGCNGGGYYDRTTAFAPVNLLPGQSYPVQINTTYGSPDYEKVSIWIDFNDNGTFEASEKLLTDLALLQSPAFATANIAIPLTAPAGVHRMRVRLVYNGADFDACSSQSYGETHDYNVNVLALAPCAGTPTSGTASATTANACIGVPFNLILTGYTFGGGITYQWYRSNAGAGTFIAIPGATAPTYTVTSQTVATDYRCTVTCTNSGQTATSNIVSVGQNLPANCYCTPTGGSSSSSYYLNSITTTAGWTNLNYSASSYNAYVNTNSTVLTSPGNNVNINLTASGNSTYYYKVWVDWNGDGVFANPGEVVLTNASYAATLSGTIPVPATTALGNYRVRTSVSYSGQVPPCGPAPYGNYVDFTLAVVTPPTCLPPTNLTLQSATTTSATVQWAVPSPAPAGGYDVYYSTSPTPPTPTTVPQFSGVSGPSQVINSLAPSTTYYIWVRAKCSASDLSYWSGPVSVFTNYCIPTAGSSSTLYYLNNIATTGGLTNITYTASSYTAYVNNSAQSFSVIPGGSVNVNMSVSSGTNYYYVWVDWNNDLVFNPATETVYASTTYQSGATTVISSVGRPSGSYRVRFGNSYIGTTTPCGPNGYGNYVDYTFIIRPCSLNAPTNVNFTAITSTSAQVNWTPAADNLNYKVYWKVTGTATWNNSSPVLAAPAINYVINGLLPFTNYDVKVVAICGTTEGAAPTYTFTTRCDPTPPTVSVSQITPTSALITWNPLVPNATYELEWKKVTDAVWQTVTTPQPPQNSYLLTGLTSFTKYEVRVRSKCIGSTSANPYSSVQVFTTVRVCEIAPPGLTITQLFPTTAEVTWDAFPGATSYLLQYRKVGIPSWTDVIATTNSYTLTNLLEVTKYEMRVANICNGTPGNFTPLYFFTTPTVTYCAMSGGASAADFISRVNVTPTGKNVMDNPSAASNYTDYTGVPKAMIELVQGSTNNKITIDRTQSAASGIAVWIDFNRNGYFDINERILAEGPNSNATTTATFTVPSDAFISMSSVKYVVMRVALQKGGVPVNCTNFANGEVEDYSVRISKLPEVNSLNQTDIMIYPNPVKSVLNVRNISAKANYKIYSSSGQLLKSGLILNNKVDVSGLVNGMYVIDIEDVKGTAQKKFIKE